MDIDDIPEQPSESAVQAEKGADKLQIQIFPHSDQSLPFVGNRNQPFVFSPVELTIAASERYEIGRKIDKNKSSQRPSSRDERAANNVQLSQEESPTLTFRSKVVSRAHADIWLGRDGQVYFKDIGSSSGTFLNRLRLSPSGKESRPYVLKSGDVVQLGVDYQGRPEEIYKAVLFKIFINRATAVPAKLAHAIKSLLSAMNPMSDETDCMSVDCCICLNSMAPYQALFLAPCSHSFHYKCVTPLLGGGFMFQCPMCRQVANLEAAVFSDEASEAGESVSEHYTQPLSAQSPKGDELPLSFLQLGGETGGETMRRTTKVNSLPNTSPIASSSREASPLGPLASAETLEHDTTASVPINITALATPNLPDTFSPSTPHNHSWALPQDVPDGNVLLLYRLLSNLELSLTKGDADASKALMGSYTASMEHFLDEACANPALKAELLQIMQGLTE